MSGRSFGEDVFSSQYPLRLSPLHHAEKLFDSHYWAGHCFPVWSMKYSPSNRIFEIGTTVYLLFLKYSRMDGKASGVWRAALWKRHMEPDFTLSVTRLVISDAERSFQSRLSLSHIAATHWGAMGCGLSGKLRFPKYRWICGCLFSTLLEKSVDLLPASPTKNRRICGLYVFEVFGGIAAGISPPILRNFCLQNRWNCVPIVFALHSALSIAISVKLLLFFYFISHNQTGMFLLQSFSLMPTAQ